MGRLQVYAVSRYAYIHPWQDHNAPDTLSVDVELYEHGSIEDATIQCSCLSASRDYIDWTGCAHLGPSIASYCRCGLSGSG